MYLHVEKTDDIFCWMRRAIVTFEFGACEARAWWPLCPTEQQPWRGLSKRSKREVDGSGNSGECFRERDMRRAKRDMWTCQIGSLVAAFVFVLYTNCISLYPLTMFYPRNRETRRPTSFGRVPSSKRRRPVQGSLVVAEILVARCRNDTSDTKRYRKWQKKNIKVFHQRDTTSDVNRPFVSRRCLCHSFLRAFTSYAAFCEPTELWRICAKHQSVRREKTTKRVRSWDWQIERLKDQNFRNSRNIRYKQTPENLLQFCDSDLLQWGDYQTTSKKWELQLKTWLDVGRWMLIVAFQMKHEMLSKCLWKVKHIETS